MQLLFNYFMGFIPPPPLCHYHYQRLRHIWIMLEPPLGIEPVTSCLRGGSDSDDLPGRPSDVDRSKTYSLHLRLLQKSATTCILKRHPALLQTLKKGGSCTSKTLKGIHHCANTPLSKMLLPALSVRLYVVSYDIVVVDDVYDGAPFIVRHVLRVVHFTSQLYLYFVVLNVMLTRVFVTKDFNSVSRIKLI